MTSMTGRWDVPTFLLADMTTPANQAVTPGAMDFHEAPGSSSEQISDEIDLVAEMLENLKDPVAITDALGDIVWVNEAYSRVTGFDRDEARGSKLSFVNPQGGRSGAEQDIARLIAAGSSWVGEIAQRRRDGVLYPARLSASAGHDSAGRLVHCLAIFYDIARYKLEEERLHREANFDTLTELPNRRLFEDRLGQTLAQARRHRSPAALLYVGLDDFNKLNETRGRLIGDGALEAVSQRLRGCTREADSVARVGGEEFAIILADFREAELAEQGSLHVANKVRSLLKEPLFANRHVITVSASIGITLFPYQRDTVGTVIARAETALSRARQQGPGSCLLDTSDTEEV